METLRAPQRIEKLATERLGMVAPGDAEAVVLERVAPPGAAGQVRRRRPVTSYDVAVPPDPHWRPMLKSRLMVAAGVLVLWVVGIEARLVVLQVVQHDELVARAERQQMSTVPAPAKRGEIFDRNGRLLAYSVDADTIYAVPTEIADRGEDRGRAVRRARRLHEEDRATSCASGCRSRARSSTCDGARRRCRPSAWPRSSSTASASARRASASIRTASWPRTCSATSASTTSAWAASKRPTTRRCAAARASCWCRPTRGATSSAASSDRRPAGASIELTIDEQLQYIAEREVRAGVEAARADGGTAVIMDPHTGEILAMASWPTFNPNDYSASPESARRNRAVQDLYEPGSTFKLVTASAAIEEGVIKPDDMIDVSAGVIRFGGRVDRRHAAATTAVCRSPT